MYASGVEETPEWQTNGELRGRHGSYFGVEGYNLSIQNSPVVLTVLFH